MSDNNIQPIQNAQNFKITVDDGSIAVPVTNRQGEELGVFYFRPTDIGIIDRFNNMAEDFDKIVEPLQNHDIRPDGTAEKDDADGIAALHEAEQRLYDACDKLFGGNMAEAFFGKMHPFSPVNGRFYCENALDVVGAFISRQFARETKKINSRAQQYTHGYRTGKHRHGRQ